MLWLTEVAVRKRMLRSGQLANGLVRTLFVVLLLTMNDRLMPQAVMAHFGGHVLIPAVILLFNVSYSDYRPHH